MLLDVRYRGMSVTHFIERLIYLVLGVMGSLLDVRYRGMSVTHKGKGERETEGNFVFIGHPIYIYPSLCHRTGAISANVELRYKNIKYFSEKRCSKYCGEERGKSK